MQRVVPTAGVDVQARSELAATIVAVIEEQGAAATEVPYAPMSIGDLGSQLSRHRADFRLCLRYCLEFLDEYRHAATATHAALLTEAPGPTGSSRWDAFLGALGEHLAFHEDLSVPAWTRAPDRFLGSWWFLSDLPSVRAAALAESPAAFRRRGIFVTRDLFDRA